MFNFERFNKSLLALFAAGATALCFLTASPSALAADKPAEPARIEAPAAAPAVTTDTEKIDNPYGLDALGRRAISWPRAR